jgi:hypothetical protein
VIVKLFAPVFVSRSYRLAEAAPTFPAVSPPIPAPDRICFGRGAAAVSSSSGLTYFFPVVMLQLRFLLVRYLQEKFTISHNHFIF